MIACALSVGCGVGFGVGIGVDVGVGMGVGIGVAVGVGATTGNDGETSSLQAPVATSITKARISPTTFKFAFITQATRYKAAPRWYGGSALYRFPFYNPANYLDGSFTFLK